MSKNLYDYLIKLQAITKIGLLYSTDPYAISNYQTIESMTKEMLEEVQDIKIAGNNYFSRDVYPTPNISVRTILFNEAGEVLMVKEKEDNGFSFPGGWCDLYDSPKQAAIREVLEEAGIEAEITNLVGVINRTPFKNQTSVPEYALFFKGKVIKDFHTHDHEISDVIWVNPHKLPPLSPKVTEGELLRMIKAAVEEIVVFD